MKVILFDVMGTLVHDPFEDAFPAFFGRELPDLIPDLDLSAWVEFELGNIEEGEFLPRLFRDRREYDQRGLIDRLAAAYRWLDGVEALLEDLRASGESMHTLSNYPSWYRRIEARLEVSRFVAWTNVSCEIGVRKPDLDAYRRAAVRVGAAPRDCLFIDDRQENCAAAMEVGMDAVRFTGAESLRGALIERGYWLGGPPVD